VANTTKHDLIAEVSRYTGLTQADTKIVIEELLETIASTRKLVRISRFVGLEPFIRKFGSPVLPEIPNRRSCSVIETSGSIV
jgi:hypothetical protein